jgi:hypothetical protein
MPHDRTFYFLSPVTFWLTSRGWRIASGHPCFRGRRGRGRPLSESDVIENLREGGLGQEEINWILRSERLAYRVDQLAKALRALERAEP